MHRPGLTVNGLQKGACRQPNRLTTLHDDRQHECFHDVSQASKAAACLSCAVLTHAMSQGRVRPRAFAPSRMFATPLATMTLNRRNVVLPKFQPNCIDARAVSDVSCCHAPNARVQDTAALPCPLFKLSPHSLTSTVKPVPLAFKTRQKSRTRSLHRPFDFRWQACAISYAALAATRLSELMQTGLDPIWHSASDR